MAGKHHKTIGGRWVVRSLFRHPSSGIWYGRVRDKRTNKIHKISTRERQKRKAEERVLEWVEERRRQEEIGIGERILFGDAFRAWLDHKGELRDRVRRGYEMDFSGVYLPAFGRHFVDAIEVKDIEQFKRSLEQKRKSAPRTVQKHLGVLRGFFRWARRRKYCAANPCEEVRVSKVHSRKEVVVLTHEEALKFLDACSTPYKRTIRSENRGEWTQEFRPPSYLFVAVVLALRLGLRKSNILQLRWNNIDFHKELVKIHRSEMKSHRDHTLPLSQETLIFLKEIYAVRKEHGSVDPGDAVLGDRVGDLKKSFRSAVKRAGLPPALVFHHLRHTFTSWLADRCTFATLQAILGHTIPNSVTGRYIHTSLFQLKRALSSLDWLAGTPPMRLRQMRVWGPKVPVEKKIVEHLLDIKRRLARLENIVPGRP